MFYEPHSNFYDSTTGNSNDQGTGTYYCPEEVYNQPLNYQIPESVVSINNLDYSEVNSQNNCMVPQVYQHHNGQNSNQVPTLKLDLSDVDMNNLGYDVCNSQNNFTCSQQNYQQENSMEEESNVSEDINEYTSKNHNLFKVKYDFNNSFGEQEKESDQPIFNDGDSMMTQSIGTTKPISKNTRDKRNSEKRKKDEVYIVQHLLRNIEFETLFTPRQEGSNIYWIDAIIKNNRVIFSREKARQMVAKVSSRNGRNREDVFNQRVENCMFSKMIKLLKTGGYKVEIRGGTTNNNREKYSSRETIMSIKTSYDTLIYHWKSKNIPKFTFKKIN